MSWITITLKKSKSDINFFTQCLKLGLKLEEICLKALLATIFEKFV